MLHIALICRKPFKGQYSIEGYFDRIATALRSLGVDVEKIEVPYHSKGLLRRVGIVIYAYLNQKNVTHITGDIQFAAILTTRKRTVLTVHDCQVLERSSGIRNKLLKFFWYTLPVKRAGAITVNSAETKRQLLKYIPSLDLEKIHVVPVSVSELFKPSKKSFSSDCPRILQIGTKRNKNLHRLILALKGLKCRLVIVGKLSNELKRDLERNEIEFENHIDLSDKELVEQYQLCDILSFVSTYEGFGMPIVEAQCAERVVVTSNCSSMPEVAGKGACFVDPFDIKSIREGFDKVINDVVYRNGLIENGRYNRKRFDNIEIAKQYLDIYQALVDVKKK